MMMNNHDVLAAYGQWVEQRIAEGFDPHFVTFMFNQMAGSPAACWQQMQRAIDEVYAKVLTRTFRVPNTVKNIPMLPLLIVAPDFPVSKRDRDHFVDIKTNDGQHAHGIWLMPPKSRMNEDLSDHFLNFQERFAGRGKVIQRIHSEPITEEPSYVTGYALKSVKSGRVSGEDIVIWPKTRREMK